MDSDSATVQTAQLPLSAATEVSLDSTGTQGSDSAQDGKPIVLADASVRRLGGELFVLWLKILATLLALKLVTLVWPVVVLLILSLMLVATFNPLVRYLQQRLKRSYAISIVVSGIMASCGGLIILMVPPLVRQARNLMLQLPDYLTQIEAAARGMGIKINLHGSSVDLTEQAASMGPQAFGVLLTVFSGITGVVTVAVLTTYLLIDGPRVATSVFGLLPRHHRLPIRRMFGEIGVQVGDYMRGQFITSVLAGLFSYAILFALEVPEPLALAFLMAAADAIPMVGPLIGTVPAVLLALTRGTTTALIVLIGYVVYYQIESHILVPRIYGKTMKMSPSIIVIAILLGATFMGILGAVLALPAAAAIPVVFRYVLEWRQREEDRQEAMESGLP